MTTATRSEYYRSPSVSFTKDVGVDREAKVIRGVTIMQLGSNSLLDSRKQFVDEVTLDQYVRLASMAAEGLRARFTHGGVGGEGGEGLGSFLGRWFNARIDGGKVRQDLHLSPRAHESLRGDIAKYTLDMSESDPDMLGASMVCTLDYAAMRKAMRADGYMPIRLRSLHGADIVDTPSLANGMFAAGLSNGEEKMEDAVQGITQEQFEAGLKTALDSFGQNLTTSILAKVSENFAAKQAEKEGEEPTPEELRKEGAQRAAQIFAAAAVSGLADHEKLATEAIENGFSVETFKASITDRLIAKNGLTKDAGDDANGEKDPHAKFKAEYKAGVDIFSADGVSEDAYIRSRCRDENLPLPPKKAE